MGNSSKRTARSVNTAERRKQALSLRIGGATYEQIGKTLGLSSSGAFRTIEEAIKEIYKEQAEEVVKLECARLDTMLLGLWSKARQGDEKAVLSVIRIMDRRASYLGLNAPTKNEHFGNMNLSNGPSIFVPEESDD